MPTNGNDSALHNGEATAEGFRATVEHAIRLKVKADRLLSQARMACGTAAILSSAVSLDELAAAHRALQAAGVPNRGVVFHRLNRRRHGRAA
jgi:hypothetical protein